MVELEGQRGGKIGDVRVISLMTAVLALWVPEYLWQRDAQDFLSYLEKEIVREHNLVRADPAAYAEFLEKLEPQFEGDLFKLADGRVLITGEGVSAVKEAIRFLHDVEPLGSVRVSRGMSLGARDLVDDQGSTGATGHIGSDGSHPWDRVSRYGKWEGSVAENVAYGPGEARDVMMQLIIDDGVKDRGHRMNIFDPAFRVVGVSCGEHARYEMMCVITYAHGYTERR